MFTLVTQYSKAMALSGERLSPYLISIFNRTWPTGFDPSGFTKGIRIAHQRSTVHNHVTG